MKYKYSILLLLMAAAMLSSCEETMSDTELPYKEKLVVTCVLEAGKPLTKFEITRTLPPLYDEPPWGNNNGFIVTGVTGSISDGDSIYPIAKKNEVLYEAAGLIPEIGKTYRLELKWKDKRAWAKTTIPQPIGIDSVGTRKEVSSWSLYDSSTVFIAYFKPKNRSVYLGYISSGSRFYGSKVRRYNRVSDSDYCILPIGPDNWYYTQPKNYTVFVESWDLPFYDYWATKNNGDSDDMIFSTSGLNIRWNLEGDGLGMFIGKSESEGYEVN